MGYAVESRLANCSTSGTVTAAKFEMEWSKQKSRQVKVSRKTGHSMGGLVGYLADGSLVENCRSTAEVYGQGNIGGLIGESGGPTAKSGRRLTKEEEPNMIKNCTASGNVIAAGGKGGGLIAKTQRYDKTENSTASGNVIALYEAGGLIGKAEVFCTISRCSATGNVASGERAITATETDIWSENYKMWDSESRYRSDVAGGLVGRNEGRMDSCKASGKVKTQYAAGGLVGRNDGIISDCLATGDVFSRDIGGGLVGINDSGCLIEEYNTSVSILGCCACGFVKSAAAGSIAGESGLRCCVSYSNEYIKKPPYGENVFTERGYTPRMFSEEQERLMSSIPPPHGHYIRSYYGFIKNSTGLLPDSGLNWEPVSRYQPSRQADLSEAAQKEHNPRSVTKEEIAKRIKAMGL